MNVNASIIRSLEKENHAFHEASRCDECTPQLKVKNGVFTTYADLPKQKTGGIPVFYDGENVLLLPYSHTMVTGSTGTGKSEVIYKNQLKLMANLAPEVRPSFLVTDLKGDISEEQARYLEDRGYRVLIFDMRNPYRSAKYNFLLSIYDDYTEAHEIEKKILGGEIGRTYRGVTYASAVEAKNEAYCRRLSLLDEVERAITEVAHIIIPIRDQRDAVWCDGARTMLKAIIYTMLRDSEDPEREMTREKFTIANVCRAAYSTRDDCDELIEWLAQAEDILCVKNALAANYRISARVTRDGYISTLNTALAPYTSSSISALTATSDEICLREVAASAEPYAIFVITDDRQKATNHLAMLLMNNLINELVTAADHRPTHALAREFIVLGDEFANMPPMPAIETKVTTLRSRRIYMMMAIQSIQQLRVVYKADIAEIIEDNCDLHLFIGCNNDETKERFARSMGRRLGVKTSFNLSNDSNMSVQKGTEDVPVIRKSDLDALTLGEFYIRARRAQNLKSRMTPHFLQDRSDEPPMPPRPLSPFDPDANVYDIYKIAAMLS